MIRQDIGRIADLRLRLLDDLGATGPGQDLQLLRRSVCSFLERQHGSGRHFSVVAEGQEGVLDVGSLEIFECLPHPRNLAGQEDYVERLRRAGDTRAGVATAIIRELVGIAKREDVGRLWLHAPSTAAIITVEPECGRYSTGRNLERLEYHDRTESKFLILTVPLSCVFRSSMDG